MPDVKTARDQASDALWRSLAFFNGFRLLVVVVLLSGVILRYERSSINHDVLADLLLELTLYGLSTILFFASNRLRWPRFRLQLTLQMCVDIVMILLMMSTLGGIRSGLGMLLLPFLASAGLIARGRMTLFHAALATICLLSESLYQAWLQGAWGSVDYFPAALLSLAFFAVAWLAHRLARYAEENRELAEQRRIDLANLAQLNARILQDVSDGVVVVDHHDMIHQFNGQIARLGALAPRQGQPLDVWSSSLAASLAQWRDGHWNGGALLRLNRKTLRPRFVGMGSDRNGDVLIYLEDMDHLRRESQQLKLAALGRLTANLAHEIRNPLGAIGHAAQLLAEEAGSDPMLARLTRIINDNTARLNRMVQEVLELNRRDRVQRSDIDLATWMGTFCDEFRQIEQITVQVPLVIEDRMPVRFDPGHLHQVLWNLMRNGWRYCSKVDDSLRLRLHQVSDGLLALDVINDGPPVAQDAQHQLFEPFFTTEAKGTGLGLYIAREICAANGAVLEYLNTPDDGVCFRIVFGVTDGEADPE